jgi:hypothetical protein
MIGQLLFGAFGLTVGLIVYGILWLRFFWLEGRKPTTDDIIKYGPAVAGGALAALIMILLAVMVPHSIVKGLAHSSRPGRADRRLSPSPLVGFGWRRGLRF